MCLAIYKPTESHIIKRQLRTGFRNNPDGAGFMFAADNKLHIRKGFFSFRSFYKAYRQAERENPQSDFVIHFRIATSGVVDAYSCHPFYVHKNLGFVHNGVFKGFGGKILSDTQHYNQTILQTYPKDFIYHKKIIKKLFEFCGYFNKLVFLNNKGESLIIGELNGIWDDDVWYSNDTYTDDILGFHTSNSATTDYYENEDVDWAECIYCSGYYPVKEMYELASETYICEICDMQESMRAEYGRKRTKITLTDDN